MSSRKSRNGKEGCNVFEKFKRIRHNALSHSNRLHYFDQSKKHLKNIFIFVKNLLSVDNKG